MVTGAIGEERAAELLRAGAQGLHPEGQIGAIAGRHPAGDWMSKKRFGNAVNPRRELREAESKFRMLFETANDGIFLLDATGFVDCNQKAASMYGLAKEGHHRSLARGILSGKTTQRTDFLRSGD